MFNLLRATRFVARLIAWLLLLIGLPLGLSLTMELLQNGTDLASLVASWQFWLATARNLVPVIVAMLAVYLLTVCFVQRLYGLKSFAEARSLVIRLVVGQPTFGPWLRIQEGVAEASDDHILTRVGGPGHLVIYNDSASLLEHGGRLSRVQGKGFPRLLSFERIYAVLDLRPKRWAVKVSAVSREGIPITCDVDVSYQIDNGDLRPTESMPYPALDAAIFWAAVSTWVRESDRPEDTQTMNWSGRVTISDVEDNLRTILANHPVEVMLEPEGVRTIRAEFAQALQKSTSQYGVKILRIELGDIKAEGEAGNWIETWQIEQIQRLATREQRRRSVTEEAQKEILDAIQARLGRTAQTTPLSAPLILLHFSDVLRQVGANPLVRERLTPGELQKLESLSKIGSFDSSVHDSLRRQGFSTAKSVADFPPRLWPEIARRYLERHQGELPLRFESGVLYLARGAILVRQWAQARLKIQRELTHTDSIKDFASVSILADTLCNAAKMEWNGSWSASGGLLGTWIGRHNLRLKIPPQFSLIFAPAPSVSHRICDILVDLAKQMESGSFFSLVVPLAIDDSAASVTKQLCTYIEDSRYADDFVILTDEDIFDVLTAATPEQRLAHLITGQVSPRTVSLFAVAGPVSDYMFFGRDLEIKTIHQGILQRDFALVGNRRIGKSSLLRQVEHFIAQSEFVSPYGLDLQDIATWGQLYDRLNKRFGWTATSREPATFRDFVTFLRRESRGRMPVLLLDEADALLASDAQEGYCLSQVWRSLAADHLCHFVLCGSRGLYHILHDPHSPHFNFADEIRLGYLPPDKAAALITRPMNDMGIELHEEEHLVERIIDLSSGHPNLVQWLCRQLIEHISRERRRYITPDDLQSVAHDRSLFADYLLETIWGDSTPLEKAITALGSPDGFTLDDIEAALETHGFAVEMEAVREALNMLTIYSVLDREDLRYSFAIRHFPDLLHRSQPIAHLLQSWRRSMASHHKEET